MPRCYLLAFLLAAALPGPTVTAQPTQKEVIAQFEKANQLIDDGEYVAAEKLHLEILGELPRLFGKDTLFEADVRNNLAMLYSSTERSKLAEPMYKRSLEIYETRQGKDHPNTAIAMGNLAELYRATARYDLAEPLYKRSLDIFEAKLGKDHPSTAMALGNVAWLYSDTGRYELAEPLYKRSLEIFEVKQGKDHPNTATAIARLAELYRATNRYKLAEPLFKRSLEIREAKLGKGHPDTVLALGDLAGLYREMGQYEAAEPLYKRGLELKEAKLGKDHPDTAIAIAHLAELYRLAGKHELAEPLFKRSLEICEAKLGKDHLDTAIATSNLAELYRATGRYEAAEPLFKRSLGIREAKLGKDHPDLVDVLHNLALLYSDTGHHELAEPLSKRSLDICETKQGKDHPNTATALNNLAELYRKTGRYEAAEPLFKRSLEIREVKLGKDHPDTCMPMNNLALLYSDTGHHELAEPLYKRSLEICEAKLGKDHPSTAIALGNLAGLYRTTNRYELAESFSKRSLEICEAKLGKDHPHTATALSHLAFLYADTGREVLGESFYKRSLEIREVKLGKDHPNTATALNSLAGLSRKMGRHELAGAFFDRARRAVQRHVARVLPGLGEREQLDFLHRTDGLQQYAALSVALAHPAEANLTVRSAEWMLNAKGMAEQARAQTLLAIRDSRDPRLAEDLQNLLALRQQLAHLSLHGPQPGQQAGHAARLTDLTAREQALATRLVQQGATVAVPNWTDLRQVQTVLPANAVYLDFARFDFLDDKRTWQPARYAVWITPKTGPTRLIDLGDAMAIDDAVASIRTALGKAKKELDAVGEIKAEKAVREPLTKLAKLVLDPLRPHLDKADRWIISPDGALWLAPWCALPLDDRTFAIEKHTIHLVVSGRDLLPRDARPGKTTNPALFADPDFDSAAATLPGETRSLSGGLKLGSIRRLPETASEAEAVTDKIAKVFGAAPTTFLEDRATSAAFLALNRPRAVILATHGFFLPYQELDPREKERLQRDPNAKPTTRIEDPLLRCGLLLAGCNKPGDAGRAGVLTGREILSVDLRGCELVILSACETGLGDVRQGEGVAGLRQAFQLAGAESVLASLWNVPDGETTLQMVAFMDALAKGKDRVEALAEAQRAIILTRRDKFGAAHPYYWAAFSLTGSAGGQR